MSDTRHYCHVDLQGELTDTLSEAPGDTTKFLGLIFCSPPPSAADQSIFYKVTAPKAQWDYAGPNTPMPAGSMVHIKGDAFIASSGQLRINNPSVIEYIGLQ